MSGGSNKRVMFSGVSDNESASESQDDNTINSNSNTLPILKVSIRIYVIYSKYKNFKKWTDTN